MVDRKFITLNEALIATAGIGILTLFVRYNKSKFLDPVLRRFRRFRGPLRHKHIEVIETVDDCQRVVGALIKQCEAFKVLGFDCEWITVGGTRRSVALLQLSSHTGLCALFRLCCLKQVPKSLRELLENDAVIKIGIAPQDDAQKLSYDYGLGVASTFDLRFLASMAGRKPEGLGKMAQSVLDLQMDKNWRLSCSNWEAKVLNSKQINYAADDALVAVEIFKKLAAELEPRRFWQFSHANYCAVLLRMEPYLDVRFKQGLLQKNQKVLASAVSKKDQSKKLQTRGMATRASVLYDNCLLEAPDGELLCTIDRKKATWYVQQSLGVEIKQEPFTVRLNFEPAGRAVGEVGHYYRMPKQNQCVVDGRSDAYIRKNVVPREYRKHFPDVMKTHTSHDILLLCPSCHQTSNYSDLKLRTKLAKLCDAPFTYADGVVKFINQPELRKVKSAAKALLFSGDKLPEERRENLQQIVAQHFADAAEITTQLLEQAAKMETTRFNKEYCQHGEKVVEKFANEFGGIIELEKLWREHFLETMKPKFMPILWNVNHNANRLEIRAQEGRVDQQDLIVAGVKANVLTETETENKNTN